MPSFEHATSIGVWFHEALVESSKLRQMTFNEEAAHRNKPNARVHHESRWSGGNDATYAEFDEPFVLILQGTHVVADEAPSPTALVNSYVPFPQGPGLAPFVRRPIPVVHGFRGRLDPFPGSPTLQTINFRDVQDIVDGMAEVPTGTASQALAMPEANVGITGIDSVTDFRTSLVIAHRWSNNNGGTSNVNAGGYLFWRVVGHVPAY